MKFVNKIKQNPQYKTVRIRFVGLFDPVRGLQSKDQPDTPAHETIEHLAILYSANERRKAFLPRYYIIAKSTVVYQRYFAGV